MKTLSYFNCNIDTIILFSIVLPTMILVILLMKLFIIGEIYKNRHGCWPISYYFGEKSGCQRMIYQTIDTNIENFELQNNNNNNDDNNSNTTLFNKIIVTPLTITNMIKNVNSYLSNGIIQCNNYILRFFFHFFKETIL